MAGSGGVAPRTCRTLFRVLLRLLPASLRPHAREMEAVATRRVADAARRGRTAAAIAAAGEATDLVWTCIRLRADRLLRPSGRFAMVTGATVLAMTALALEVEIRPSGLGAAGVDSMDIRATDPAGEFTLSIRQGRVVAATVDGRPVARERVRHEGDSVRLLAPGGKAVVSVAFDRRRGGIRWEARPAVRQEGPPEGAVRVVSAAIRSLRETGPEAGPSIWPGFRPDTVPIRFVLPAHGALLAHWGEPLPDGYEPVEGSELAWRAATETGAASTGSRLEGRGVAQVVVRDVDLEENGPAGLLGTAVHEAFHVYAESRRREGRWFGSGENSFLVSSYPVFDAENERGVALEGLLLLEALTETDGGEARAAAERFLAVREARQRALGPTLAEFEMKAEMNEGLAEYALVRVVPEPFLTTATIRRLADLTADPERSIRLRYYSTGSALALLLDRLAGPGWKERLERENVPLQDALATVIGYREREARLRRAALGRHGGEEPVRRSEERIQALADLRRGRAEEIVAEPGIQVVVSMRDAGGRIGLCGLDPQNLLQGPDDVLLHTRWLRPCAGSSLGGEVNTPAVHDRAAGTLKMVAGSEEEVTITVGGEPIELRDGERREGAEDVEITSPRLTLTSARADVIRDGRRIELVPQGE